MRLLTPTLQVKIIIITAAYPIAPNIIKLAAVSIKISVHESSNTNPISKIRFFSCGNTKLYINFNSLIMVKSCKTSPVRSFDIMTTIEIHLEKVATAPSSTPACCKLRISISSTVDVIEVHSINRQT